MAGTIALCALCLFVGGVVGMVIGEMNTARNNRVAIEGWDLLNSLRAPEGAEVAFCCDNPDYFSGEANSVVDVCADWTGWQRREFGGDTVLEALQAAYNERLAS